MKAAVLGATGYTGGVLLRLLEEHPEVTEILPVTSSRMGQKLSTIDAGLGRGLKKCPDDKLLSLEDAKALEPEVVFAALPHKASAEACSPFIGSSVVIDLSADFRIKTPELYQQSYGQDWPFPELQDKAVYGLTEWYRKDIQGAKLIANPGCFPTSTLIPLLPLLKAGMVQGPAIVNSMTGVSGAGKKALTNLLYVERDENSGAYNPGSKHRHQKEILQEANLVAPLESILFTPHLIPLKRGMITTQVLGIAGGAKEADFHQVFLQLQEENPFVFYTQDSLPQSRNVQGTNRIDLSFQVEGDKVMLFSAIDNLMKGASGEAVQNMNVIFGFDETTGLRLQGEV
jgi:N-acetyl-gamma-glutamyl-phosphate reductase